MELTENTTGRKPAPGAFHQPAVLFEGLVKLENEAIRFLHSKVSLFLKIKTRTTTATLMDVEEMANDAVLLTAMKISREEYTFQGNSPVSYATVVAENLLRNFSRKKRLWMGDFGEAEPSLEAEVETYLQRKETEQMIGSVLAKLDTRCQLLIRLHFYQNLTDREVIDKGLSPYSTTDSLKSKRCKCLRKLKALLNAENLNT